MSALSVLPKSWTEREIAEILPWVTDEDREELDRLLLQSRTDVRSPRDSLAEYVNQTSGFECEPWQEMMCSQLERVRTEKGLRLLVHGPPQHGKSIIISQRLPSWVLGLSPDFRIRLACYNVTHATRFSRVNLDLMRGPDYREWFTDPGLLLPKVAAADEWSTAARSARRDAQPSFAALGLGSGFVGLGADLLIVDDPYKNREEAFSETINQNIFLWWTEVVVPRLNEATNVVLMFHRWKEDDLAGKLLKQGGWEYLRFPAIADGKAGDPTRREVGEALSTRYSIPFLRNVERVQGVRAFSSLYQGDPSPDKGTMFQAGWFQSYESEGEFYTLHRGSRVERVRKTDCWLLETVDWASTEKTLADWTAVGSWAVTPGRDLLLLDVRREQIEGPEAVDLAYQAYCAYRPQYAVVEKNGVGLPLTQALERKNIAVKGVVQSRDKVSRASKLAVRYQSGSVYHPVDAPWRSDYEGELLAFPGGAKDDQVDMASLAAGAVELAALILPEFGHGAHVADGPLEADPDLPFLCGWASEPCLAFVLTQVDRSGQWRLLTCATADRGTAALEWAEGLLEAVQARYAEPWGKALADLDVRGYAHPDWFEEKAGLAAEGRELLRVLRRGRRSFSGYDEDLDGGQAGLGLRFLRGEATLRGRQEALRGRLQKLLPGGVTGLLVDPRANSIIEAFSGGYQFKQLANGLWDVNPESNRYSALIDALGHVAARLYNVRARNEDEELVGAVSLARGAGRRRV
jgi:predicted phage terminase large subunit-like protein